MLSQLFVILVYTSCALSTEEVYAGKKLGEFNSYHHQVGGEVFAVDERTLLIKKFTYDGNGKDTFFWAGSSPRAGPLGFLVPNEFGRTNVLDRYLNEDIQIILPESRKITDIKWLSVYDLTRLESFGDIYILPGFEPPQTIHLPRFQSRAERVSSGDVVVVDSKTLLIKDFTFDGRGETYFSVGKGQTPNVKGQRIPDEHGYMTPLRRYDLADLRIVLPGQLDVFNIEWLALLDRSTSTLLGHINIPNELNVPPSLVTVIEHEMVTPNCEQLHRNLQFGWLIEGDVITVEVAANIGQDDYASIGISGSQTESKMVGGDAFMGYRDTYNGYIVDLNMTSYFPCTELVGQKRGVCEDDEVGGQQSYQLLSSSRIDGITVFKFRRPLVTPDNGDKPYPRNGDAQLIWALGHLDHIHARPRPAMHYAWSKDSQKLQFSRPAQKNCFAFTRDQEPPPKPWKQVHLTHPSRNLTFHLGPDGGPRGYQGQTKQLAVTGLSWYVDGFLVPELYLTRDQTYKFRVFGGSNPYEPTTYHPLIITDEPRGAFSQLKPQKQSQVRIFAGIDRSVRGDIRPKRGGDLCLWKHPKRMDRRRDEDLTTFVDFRNSLEFSCGSSPKVKPSILEFTPNRSWPDTLYYNSWSGENMGWKIHILDPAGPDLF